MESRWPVDRAAEAYSRTRMFMPAIAPAAELRTLGATRHHGASGCRRSFSSAASALRRGRVDGWPPDAQFGPYDSQRVTGAFWHVGAGEVAA